MKQAYFIAFFLTSILLLNSCGKESSTTIERIPHELEGTWFRSFPNKVWVGHNEPIIERGETHIRVTFHDTGEFEYNRTVLGLYKGTTMDDTSAISVELGTYSPEEESIEIILEKFFFWDSFYGDDVWISEGNVNPSRFKDASYEIHGDELNLVYFTFTDIVTSEQEIPGLQKYDEVFVKDE